MSACQLDSDQMSKKSDHIFGHLKKLVTLDLSSNSLHSLSKRTFDRNTELAFLNLTENNFQYVPFDLADRPNLRELDLTDNLIASLSVRETQDMDDLVRQFGSFNLHLSGNILSCGCQSLQFLQWLVMTRVTLDADGNFTCMNDDGELTFTSKYRDLEKVWRHCMGTFYFALSLVLFCFMAVGFLTCYIVTKYKTFIMCSLIQIVGGFKRKTKNDYDTGVFIGYADEEYRFPCTELREFIEKTLGLSTYIKDRDSPVSSNKANSLVTAINSSWRIVLVCSQPFLRDDQWAVFTMKWAMLSQTPANPARVIVLVREDLLDDLPSEVISGVASENIIVVASWELDYGVEQKLRTLLVP
ncbi:toll-like receptor 4 [Physella acuta]|uniref:toll-like receptor 4 n=1 Tax=Physella acuta TaxID=109671 RepID=UPI0027DAC088|nr:toll-like receptor 4 [Physella acuta]